jgi:hypothetical protein
MDRTLADVPKKQWSRMATKEQWHRMVTKSIFHVNATPLPGLWELGRFPYLDEEYPHPLVRQLLEEFLGMGDTIRLYWSSGSNAGNHKTRRWHRDHGWLSDGYLSQGKWEKIDAYTFLLISTKRNDRNLGTIFKKARGMEYQIYPNRLYLHRYNLIHRSPPKTDTQRVMTRMHVEAKIYPILSEIEKVKYHGNF